MHDPLRPTFERDVPGLNADSLLERDLGVLGSEDGGLPHRQAGQHLLIWLPKTEQHLWSPWLHLDVTETSGDPDSSTLFGRFTPAPSMWTALMFSYAVLAFIAICGGVFGYSQWLINESPWALWLVPVCALLAVAIPLASRAGQSLAKEQMGRLSSVVERALP